MDGLLKTLSSRFLVAALLIPWFALPLAASEAQWIWATAAENESIPEGESCFFRKVINLRVEAIGQIEIAADDSYELFVNGKPVGSGNREMHVSAAITAAHPPATATGMGAKN